MAASVASLAYPVAMKPIGFSKKASGGEQSESGLGASIATSHLRKNYLWPSLSYHRLGCVGFGEPQGGE